LRSISGTTEYESDRYQVTDVAQWIWPQYADFVRSKLDTFNQSLSDKVLDSFAPELVRCLAILIFCVLLENNPH